MAQSAGDELSRAQLDAQPWDSHRAGHVAQMFVITVNDLDLSIGTFVSFVGCVAATWLRDAPLLGFAVLLGGVAVYALMGAVIYLRNVPSIVVTLGMLFVWQGLAILVLPKPGGKPPSWLHDLMNFHMPYAPFPISPQSSSRRSFTSG